MKGGVYIYAAIACALVAGSMGLDAEMEELAKMLRESCGDETGVDLGLVSKVNAGADLMPDPKLKCYIKCIMETAGMMSDGQIEVEAVIAMLPEDVKARNENNLRGCGTKKGADDCDTAFLTHVCWQTVNKADYFLV